VKIFFLLKSKKTPSSRIRILDIFPELQKHGIEPEVEFLPSGILRRWLLFRKCRRFDAVVLQKRLLGILELNELRRKSKKLGFDFDDAIYLRNSSPSQNLKDYVSETRTQMFKRTVKACDLVIAANRTLAEKTTEFEPDAQVATIPSPVRIEDLLFKKDCMIKDLPVIGWIGTRVNLQFLEYIAPALRELRKEMEFILRIMSDTEIRISGVRTEFVKWSVETQNCELRNFDIGIMPLSQDPFTEGKSAYKLIQYLAAGVPSVCSPIGMNREFCNGDKYALSAPEPADFCWRILQLIKDRELRERLRAKGRPFVSGRFDIPVVGASYAETLRKLLQAKAPGMRRASRK